MYEIIRKTKHLNVINIGLERTIVNLFKLYAVQLLGIYNI